MVPLEVKKSAEDLVPKKVEFIFYDLNGNSFSKTIEEKEYNKLFVFGKNVVVDKENQTTEVSFTAVNNQEKDIDFIELRIYDEESYHIFSFNYAIDEIDFIFEVYGR